jgi:hypothetical protein
MLKLSNELRDEIHAISVEHGWHETKQPSSHWLCLVISELMEAVEADRKGIKSQIVRFNKDMDYLIHEFKLYGERYNKAFMDEFSRYIKDTVEDELADAVIRLLDFAGETGTDIDIMANLLEHNERYVATADTRFTGFIFALCGILTNDERNIDWVIRNSLQRIDYICRSLGIDLNPFIRLKIEYNRLRPYKHGGKEY